MDIVLASASPRRRELLTTAGLSFRVLTADTDETVPPGTHPERAVSLLSERKAAAVKEKYSLGDDTLIIAADTVVYHNGMILGKPKDEADAVAMLTSLSGSEHSVSTGLALSYGGRTVSEPVSTVIRFRELSREEIELYVKTGEPMDKAGAYGIQVKASMFVTGIEGDYFATVGLPVCRLMTLAREEFGIDLSVTALRGASDNK